MRARQREVRSTGVTVFCGLLDDGHSDFDVPIFALASAMDGISGEEVTETAGFASEWEASRLVIIETSACHFTGGRRVSLSDYTCGQREWLSTFISARCCAWGLSRAAGGGWVTSTKCLLDDGRMLFILSGTVASFCFLCHAERWVDTISSSERVMRKGEKTQ